MMSGTDGCAPEQRILLGRPWLRWSIRRVKEAHPVVPFGFVYH
jgi:hypothetical protein